MLRCCGVHNSEPSYLDRLLCDTSYSCDDAPVTAFKDLARGVDIPIQRAHYNNRSTTVTLPQVAFFKL